MAAGVLGMTRRRAGRPCAPRQPAPQGLTGQAGGDGHHRLPIPQGGDQLGEHSSIIWGLTHRKTYSAWAAAARLSSATAHPSSAARASALARVRLATTTCSAPHGPARRLNQRRAHVSRSDKCRFFHPAPPFRIVCNQCFLFRPPVLFDGRLPPEGRPRSGHASPVDHRQRSPAPGILGPSPGGGPPDAAPHRRRCRCRGFRPRSGGYKPTSSWSHHSGRSSGSSSSSRNTAATALSYSPVSRAFRMALACRWLSPNRWMR